MFLLIAIDYSLIPCKFRLKAHTKKRNLSITIKTRKFASHQISIKLYYFMRFDKRLTFGSFEKFRNRDQSELIMNHETKNSHL